MHNSLTSHAVIKRDIKEKTFGGRWSPIYSLMEGLHVWGAGRLVTLNSATHANLQTPDVDRLRGVDDGSQLTYRLHAAVLLQADSDITPHRAIFLSSSAGYSAATPPMHYIDVTRNWVAAD